MNAKNLTVFFLALMTVLLVVGSIDATTMQVQTGLVEIDSVEIDGVDTDYW